MIAASVIPCIVIVLDILFKHTLWLGFPARVTLSWFYVESTIEVYCCEAVIAASVKPCIVILSSAFVSNALYDWCPWPRYRTRVTLSWFYVESSIKVCFCEAEIVASVKPCIVIVLVILFKHTLWLGACDLDIALEWLYHDFTSSLPLKCISL